MEIIQLFKALADETRMRILNLLKNGELCVCDIEDVLDIQQSNASRHLNKLKVAGLIISAKKSQWVYYRVNDEIIIKYPFIIGIINDEFGKINICEDDIERLTQHKASGASCEKRMKRP
ncbi:MAG: metalloregulator ArsR/SmtB family transcription factor [Syntrophomonas sp.]|nr:metalloregulator ArsR/SmtB family transcription factor [Syntrophomonas sp.]